MAELWDALDAQFFLGGSVNGGFGVTRAEWILGGVSGIRSHIKQLQTVSFSDKMISFGGAAVVIFSNL
jgi:hypothetical protein